MTLKKAQFRQEIWFYEDRILVEKTSCTVEIPYIEIADIKEMDKNGNDYI